MMKATSICDLIIKYEERKAACPYGYEVVR